MRFVAWPEDAADRERVGGKAWALASARTAGLPVPDWFVVTSDAFESSCALPGAIDQARDAVMPSPEVEQAVAAAVVTLGSGVVGDGNTRNVNRGGGSLVSEVRFAVRSSAPQEDAAGGSMAGQLESRLFVRPEDVALQVSAIWRSAFSARALRYRRELGLAPTAAAPGVIVQRMVLATASGIAFSADPMSGRRSVCVVTAVRGSCDRLASGEVDGDTWHVRRDDRILQQSPDADTLTVAQVRAVAALARAAAAHFGTPQDIEWALEGDHLWLLQSRPITSLRHIADPDGAPRLWDNSNIVESYSGVATPLTFSFASDVYAHVYRQFCRVMHVPDSAIDAEDTAFRNMLGLIHGRMYYNLGSWYRVLALLPGFSRNRRFMDQMMGVGPEAGEDELEVLRALSKERASGGIRDAARTGLVLASMVRHHLTISRSIERFTTRLNAALEQRIVPLTDQRPDELVAHYLDLRKKLLLKWDAPIVNDFLTMIFHGAAKQAAERWCGNRDGRLLAALLTGPHELSGRIAGAKCGQGPHGTGSVRQKPDTTYYGLASAAPAMRLRRLASIANDIPELVALLDTGTVPQVTAAMRRHPDFEAEYRSYLLTFGDRTVNELKLETLTLHDDPLPLIRSIGALARQLRTQPDLDAQGHGRIAMEAAARVTRALARHPLRRLVFGWLVRHARARVRDRESLRLERTRLFARVRAIFVQLGRRLHDAGALRNPRDVFYLSVDEVIAFVEGRAISTSLADLAALRAREFESYARERRPSPRFVTRGPVYHANEFAPASAAGSRLEATSSCQVRLKPDTTPGVRVKPDTTYCETERTGVGCCAGVVRGRALIVHDPAAATVAPGSILVATHTDPGWILLFPAALGVIVERGSLLSHAAIVARELRVPTIVGAAGATHWLNDGDLVEMDGATGAIRLLERFDASAGSFARACRA